MPESDPLIGQSDYTDIESSQTIETKDFCHVTCQQYFFTWFACTILLLILTGLLVFVAELEALALIVGSVVPAAVILFLAKKKFHDHVLLGQMIVTFFEAIMWMLPLLIFDMLGMSLITALLPSKEKEVTFLSVLQVLFVSLFFAGFCEEFLKYIVIARLQKSPLISSWKSLLVYGICAGAGFATAENLSYVMRSDFGTAIVRAFLSVPLHCLTGSLLGMMIGTQRFFGADVVPFWKIMIIPWAIHGGFDTSLMVAELWGEDPLSILGPIFAFLVYICGIIYARYLYIETDAMLPPADKTIHDMLLSSNQTILGANGINHWNGDYDFVCDCCVCCQCCCQSKPVTKGNENNSTGRDPAEFDDNTYQSTNEAVL